MGRASININELVGTFGIGNALHLVKIIAEHLAGTLECTFETVR